MSVQQDNKEIMDKAKKSDMAQVTVRETNLRHAENLSDKLGEAHMNILSTKKLVICLASLALACMLSFMDQTGVTVALAEIGNDLDAETTINWAGTSHLLANCVCQVLFGRLADIFGRKTVLLTCIAILVVSDVCCGVAQTGEQFYVFRAFAGIGNGGISSLCMVILSDIVTLKQRGKYQGILGSSVGLGNAIGPFVMTGFIQRYSWRGFYYFLPPAGCLVFLVIYFIVEGRSSQLNSVLTKRQKFKEVDYPSMVLTTLSLTFILIPLSGGGSQFPWNSPIVISMFTIGGILFIAFLWVEKTTKKLPMVPLDLFKVPSLCLLLSSNFFYGMNYYGFLYVNQYYFQLVKGRSILQTSCFLLALVITQSISSIVSGVIISKTGHYIYVVMIGYATWLLSDCLLVLWDEDVNDGVNVVVMLLMGFGVGFTFQPTMVAVQAQAKKAQRAVVISCRNVMRSFGGAVGIAVSTVTISNTLIKDLNSQRASELLDDDYISYVKEHIYSLVRTDGLDDQQIRYVRNIYSKALKNYFYVLIPLMGLCLVSSFFVKDRGLHCIDEVAPSDKKDDIETPKTAEGLSQENSVSEKK